MKYPHCSEAIEDHSAFCAYCGGEVGHKFCAHCGGTVGEKTSGAKGLLVVLLLLFGFGIVGLQLVRSQNTPPFSPTAAVPLSTVSQKPYTILSSDETLFAGHRFRTILVRVSPYAQEVGVVSSALDIAREKLGEDPDSITDIRLFTTDETARNPDNWNAQAIAVNLERNPTYAFPATDFKEVGEHVFVRWRE